MGGSCDLSVDAEEVSSEVEQDACASEPTSLTTVVGLPSQLSLGFSQTHFSRQKKPELKCEGCLLQGGGSQSCSGQ